MTRKYTTKVFNTAVFDKYIGHLKDSSLRILEIGTFEGQTTNYLLDNWQNSQVVTIDPVEQYPIEGYETYIRPELLDTIHNNLGWTDRVTFLHAYSHDALQDLEYDTFDVAFIDGDHRADSVYYDSCLTYPLIKKGGLMIFDDYFWVPKTYKEKVYDINCPKLGIDRFLTEYANLNILEQSYIVVVKV